MKNLLFQKKSFTLAARKYQILRGRKTHFRKHHMSNITFRYHISKNITFVSKICKCNIFKTHILKTVSHFKVDITLQNYHISDIFIFSKYHISDKILHIGPNITF